MSASKKPARKGKEWSELERTAYHEAGHAVMAYLLEMPFGETSIVQNGEELGRMQPENVEEYLARRGSLHTFKHVLALESFILVQLAGDASELVFTRSLSGGGLNDYIRASEILAVLCPEQTLRECAFEWLKEKARLIVAVHAVEIDTVTSALLARGSLTRDEIIACIAEVSGEADEGGTNEVGSDL